METVVGLLLISIQVSHGVESFCDGRQDEAQCFGALGESLCLQLMNNTSEIHSFRWKKSNLIIFGWRINKIVTNTMGSRSLFTPSNGTLRLSNLIKDDSGGYELESFDSNGIRGEHKTLQLTVQARVSSVQLVSECLSPGQMKVSCSSERGDSPQYSWTLDGHTLTDSELVSGNNQTNIIVLRQNISGRLICSVRNRVSESFKETSISTCGFINCPSNGTQVSEGFFDKNNTRIKTTSKNTELNSEDLNSNVSWLIAQWPVMAGLFSGLVFFSAVGAAVVCVMRKKENTEAEEAGGELIYTSVTFKQQQQRDVEQSVEEENGKVDVSNDPHQLDPEEAACVYTQVLRHS